MGKKQAGKLKHAVYILAAAGMLFYAFAGVDLADLDGAGGLFWFLWLVFAGVIIAANANILLMSEEKREDLARVKRAKIAQREKTIMNFVDRRAKSEVRRVRGR
ncbi:hypothetical protein RB620_23225 [Paenibacillus sp. LHD-117]|uniref:hypothetical protein n=1 Tax=Paenibacillus sp. LHD-117 TaxID=3071412 RepID=UPI0027DF1FEF|nr:hypothetical protein [Paenibacillus sp. LHD-117]MDQ6422346.1 hypothetical protein [Paenibacillus sp. LHD-117]